MRRLTAALVVACSSVLFAPETTMALALASTRGNADRGGCEFEEIQLASDGATERRSLEMGERVAPNRTMNGTVAADEYHYYHLCILRHEHEHQINVNLTIEQDKGYGEDGDASLFISSLEKYPRMGHASWISQRVGSDFVKLYTYLDGFPRKSDVLNRSLSLHIGVKGVDAHVRYNLTVSVLDLPINSDIASREKYYTSLHRAQQRSRLRGS